MTESDLDAYNQGIVEGMKHRTPSEQTLKEISELKEEWADFKRRSVNILATGVFVVAGYAIWVGTIQQQITDHSDRLSEAERIHQELATKQQSSEVVQADIRARLVSIELTLSEIKAELKKK